MMDSQQVAEWREKAEKWDEFTEEYVDVETGELRPGVQQQILDNLEIVEKLQQLDLKGAIDCSANCGYDKLSDDLFEVKKLLSIKEGESK